MDSFLQNSMNSPQLRAVYQVQEEPSNDFHLEPQYGAGAYSSSVILDHQGPDQAYPASGQEDPMRNASAHQFKESDLRLQAPERATTSDNDQTSAWSIHNEDIPSTTRGLQPQYMGPDHSAYRYSDAIGLTNVPQTSHRHKDAGNPTTPHRPHHPRSYSTGDSFRRRTTSSTSIPSGYPRTLQSSVSDQNPTFSGMANAVSISSPSSIHPQFSPEQLPLHSQHWTQAAAMNPMPDTH